MNANELLLILDDALDLGPGTLQGHEELSTLEWNSLAVLSFIAAVDEKYQVIISPKNIMEAETINDLLVLVDKKLLVRNDG